MKKILLVSGLVLSASALGQSVFNKMSVDFGWGVNKALSGPMMGSAVNKQFAHTELGARYMMNNRWGLYGGFVYENYKTTLSSVDYTTNSVAIKLEGVLNLRNSLDFNTFTKKFGAFGHSGPSLVLNSGKASVGSSSYKMEKLAGWTTGLTLQYKATSKLSVKGDVSFVAYLQGTRSLDLQTKNNSGLTNGYDGTSGNMTIGLSYYLGSNPEHADWTPTNYGDAEAMAALKAKIEKIEKDMLDDDKDGVSNYLDQELGTLAGANVDTKGKTVKVEEIIDIDLDGILDINDFCPTIKGIAAANGCPDKDGDSVYDFVDKCPDALGLSVDNGCPVLANSNSNSNSNSNISSKKGINDVQFEIGKYVILEKHLPILEKVAKIMLTNPTYKLALSGHADMTGISVENLQLSKDRAKAIKSYLVDKGISENRITAMGFGDSQPKVSNATAKGRSANRRVEFLITQ